MPRFRRRSTSYLLILLVLAWLPRAAAWAATAEQATDGLTRSDSAECMRCHWMETMAYRDRETREIVDLSVDADAYRHSVHHGLACGDCHDRGYKRYPHRTSSADAELTCLGCQEEHQDEEQYDPPKLTGLYRNLPLGTRSCPL
jgi:hypothetical protein